MCAVLDTGPHVPSAFVYGNNFWFTASALCGFVNEAPRMSLTPSMPKRMRADLVASRSPVRMRHRMLYANASAGMQVDSNFPLLVSSAILVGDGGFIFSWSGFAYNQFHRISTSACCDFEDTAQQHGAHYTIIVVADQTRQSFVRKTR